MYVWPLASYSIDIIWLVVCNNWPVLSSHINLLCIGLRSHTKSFSADQIKWLMLILTV